MKSQDAEYFRVLDELMTGDEILFRVGIGHLLSVGYDNLTEEAVQRTIEVIEKRRRRWMRSQFQSSLRSIR